MTLPPLPDRSCVRVALGYEHDTSLKAGSRFYIAYAGSAPTGANCVALATAISGFWTSELAGTMNTDWALQEVDVLDITTTSGLSGVWTGEEAGSATGTAMPAQTAFNCEYGIARRYRGGKPRMYLPPAVTAQTESDVQWTAGWVTTVQTAIEAFFTAIAGESVGAMGALSHINLSYYESFTNVTNTSGRTRAAPKYRTTALSDAVTSYIGKQEISSQRRRRISTTY